MEVSETIHTRGLVLLHVRPLSQKDGGATWVWVAVTTFVIILTVLFKEEPGYLSQYSD